MTNSSPPEPPVKRSLTIAGHETSLSLEPPFWRALEAASQRAGIPMNALVAQIDVWRLKAAHPVNLASATRSWLFNDLENRSQKH